jgi:hypothetical protein
MMGRLLIVDFDTFYRLKNSEEAKNHRDRASFLRFFAVQKQSAQLPAAWRWLSA